MNLKDMTEEAAFRLGLKNPMGVLAQETTSVFLRWKNEGGKYEQVEIAPEAVLLHYGDVTAETLKKEINRLIQAGETTVLVGGD